MVIIINLYKSQSHQSFYMSMTFNILFMSLHEYYQHTFDYLDNKLQFNKDENVYRFAVKEELLKRER